MRRVLQGLMMAALCNVGALQAQSAPAMKYPPLSGYLMARDAEMALAKTAAPAAMADGATIKILTKTGYEVVREGSNGAVCLVLRGFAGPTFTPAPFRNLVYDPTVRAPICFTAPAAKDVLPYYELRTRLGLAGNGPDQITAGVQAAYAKGDLPKRNAVTFAYMLSGSQHLGPGIGAWHPHVMVFAPNYTNSMVGGNEFGGPLPQVTDDAGTPFTVVVIPVDDKLAMRVP